METSQEKYRKIKEFGLSQGLPEIPPYLYSKLEEAYNQYLQLAGILVGDFDEVKIQEHREKYKHLYSGLRQGSPIFDDDNCLEYMNLVSGISKKFCAVYMYLDYLETIASDGVVLGKDSWEDLLNSQLWFTKQVIKKEEEEYQKIQKKILESKNTQSHQSSTTSTAILQYKGSGKSIVMFPYAAKENQIKIRFKKKS